MAGRRGFFHASAWQTFRTLFFSPIRGEWPAAVLGRRSRGVSPPQAHGKEPSHTLFFSPIRGEWPAAASADDRGGFFGASTWQEPSRTLFFSPIRGEWPAAVLGRRSRGVSPPQAHGEDLSHSLLLPHQGGVAGCRPRQTVEGGFPAASTRQRTLSHSLLLPHQGGVAGCRPRQTVEGGFPAASTWQRPLTRSSSPPSGGSGRLPSSADGRGGFPRRKHMAKTSHTLFFSPIRGEWPAAVLGRRSRGVSPPQAHGEDLSHSLLLPHQGGVAGCRPRQTVEGGFPAASTWQRPLTLFSSPPSGGSGRLPSSADGRGGFLGASTWQRTSRTLFFSPIRGEWPAAVLGRRSRGVPQPRDPLRPGTKPPAHLSCLSLNARIGY